MAKLGLFMEEDKKGELTGRWQVAFEEEDEVLDTFDTEEEAQAAMEKLQAELDRNDKIEAEYRQWEKDCMARHNISQEDLRVFLANGPVGE
ncbi:hypothetical protein LCGC14_0262810 [marine sediment metagenome]|uniref:Uncharacterized protein n=1 Tax=marine sediment metagenome TaxID=412755 RepID=A0A0F9UI13_9ZZZZ